jgi:hypothetical protein
MIRTIYFKAGGYILHTILVIRIQAKILSHRTIYQNEFLFCISEPHLVLDASMSAIACLSPPVSPSAISGFLLSLLSVADIRPDSDLLFRLR